MTTTPKPLELAAVKPAHQRCALLGCILLILVSAPLASGDIIYQVSADTTAIQGMVGEFDLQFNPGLMPGTSGGSLPATATITDIVTDGTGLSLYTTDGDVSTTPSLNTFSMTLAGTLIINNTDTLNDYLENITFGTRIAFTLDLSGPGVTSPDSSLPASSFALNLYDASFNPLLTTDTSGSVVTISLNSDGTTSPENFPSDSSGGAPSGGYTPQPSGAVPEPSTFGLFCIGLVGLIGSRWRRRKVAA